ncbi:MAG: transport protein TonB [Mucilaginibacter sp.]|nr:transport protein TonB [Mucilaginibacter sp.]
MKKILILLFLMPIAYKAAAQQSTAIADTILVGSIDKNCPGGFDAFNMFIRKKTHPPAIARENHKVGTTYVSFIIEPDGSVSNVFTILAIGFGMDEEAVRVIRNTGNWTPAMVDGKAVRCFCRAAIQFSADESKHEAWINAKRID